LTRRMESQIGGGIAVLVVLAVIFIVLLSLGAIDKAPINGMSVGAAKYSEPIVMPAAKDVLHQKEQS
jgi:hypothetical protein